MDNPHIHVLLLEDNPADVIVLEATLADIPLVTFHVTAVERLSNGLACLAERPFDVVLLDLGLPDSQGLATFTELHAYAPAVPVVVLSGMHGPLDGMFRQVASTIFKESRVVVAHISCFGPISKEVEKEFGRASEDLVLLGALDILRPQLFGRPLVKIFPLLPPHRQGTEFR
ncbi:MAG: response regulator [Spirochaetota bacterium]